MNTLLKVEDIHKRYGSEEVLKGVFAGATLVGLDLSWVDDCVSLG